jgi:hypothetical protein
MRTFYAITAAVVIVGLYAGTGLINETTWTKPGFLSALALFIRRQAPAPSQR